MSTAASSAAAAEEIRLRRFIWLDVATTGFAVAVIAAAYVFVEPSGWLLVLGVLVLVAGLVMRSGLGPLATGDREGAVRRMAVANWSIAVATSAIAPFCWPLQLLAALLPSVIAAPHVTRARLRMYVLVSLAVSVVVAAVGSLQDFSGFQDEIPAWTTDGIVLLFTPFMGAMVVMTALQHSTRLRTALDETLAVNEALSESRLRVVAATDRERRRVERDIHDGAQQRLTALRVGLRLAEARCRDHPEQIAEVFERLRAEVQDAHDELRGLAHGVYPTVLTQHGLGEALAAAADRCPVPVEVDVGPLGRFSSEVEAAVYFCCAEALQNAVIHGGPDVTVRLSASVVNGTGDAATVTFCVADDGVGFDASTATDSHGLENLRDRMHAAGGDLVVDSTADDGTRISGTVPLVRP